MALVFKIAFALIVSGAFIILAPPSVTALRLVLAITTPPVPLHVAGNSGPVV